MLPPAPCDWPALRRGGDRRGGEVRGKGGGSGPRRPGAPHQGREGGCGLRRGLRRRCCRLSWKKNVPGVGSGSWPRPWGRGRAGLATRSPPPPQVALPKAKRSQRCERGVLGTARFKRVGGTSGTRLKYYCTSKRCSKKKKSLLFFFAVIRQLQNQISDLFLAPAATVFY